METAIKATHVVKDYGRGTGVVHALRDVSLDFEKGKFTVIMGPSGSGKSTLMHTLAGLDTVTAGSIVINNKEITTMSDKQLTELRRNDIGFIFQSFNLLPMFTAEQNIVMPLTIAGKKVNKSWLQTLITTLDLGQRVRHLPSEMSGGQQQRVAIARALITKPSVIFADEPTGNLDSESSRDVLQFLQYSVRNLNQTLVMVTHDPFAAAYADRAIVIADGSVYADIEKPTVEGMQQVLLEARKQTAHTRR